MQVAFEHCVGEWTEKVDENGKKFFSIDNNPSNSSWESFCNENVSFIDSIESVEMVRNIRKIFNGGFNGGFNFAKAWFVG